MKIKYLPVSLFLVFSLHAGQNINAANLPLPAQTVVSHYNNASVNYTRGEIKAVLRLVLSEMYDIPEICIIDDALLMQDYGLDSLDMLDYVSTCSDALGIKIDLSYELEHANELTINILTDVFYFLSLVNI